MKLRACLAVGILFLLGSIFPISSARVAAAGESLSPQVSGEIILVAGDVIDVEWDISDYVPPAGERFRRWELYRGASPAGGARITSGSQPDARIYTDDERADGATYYYRLEIVNCVSPCLTSEDERRHTAFGDSAKAGPFQGVVKQDLFLKQRVYQFGDAGLGGSFSVQVVDGATLSAGGGTELRGGGISALNGNLVVGGATLNQVGLTYGDYYDEGVTGFGQVSGASFIGGTISVYGSSHVVIQGNSGDFDIFTGHQPQVTISKNTMTGIIEINGGTVAQITDNKISDGRIEVSGYGAAVGSEAYASITGNSITSAYKATTAYIDVDYGASVVATNNILNWTGFHGSESTVLMWASGYTGRTTRLTAQGNTLLNGKLVATRGAEINFTDNVVKDGGAAISIGCVVCGTSTQATGRIERNTLQGGWGLELWVGSNSVAIQDNCIRGNNPGATLDPFMNAVVDLRNNYWGHESGPTHSTVPGGQGDRVDGALALLDPWDTTDSNCRGDPPILQDLTIPGVEAVQVVQSILSPVRLVAGKPTLLRIYPRSRTYVEPGVRYDVSAFRGANYIGTLEGEVDVYPFSYLDQARADLSHSLNLELPEHWLEGTLEFKIEINRLDRVTEVDYSNNIIYHTITFEETRPLKVLIQPIRHRASAYLPLELPDLPALPGLSGFAGNGYPVPGLEYTILPPIEWPYEMSIMRKDIEREHSQILLRELTATLERWNARRPADQRYDQIHGVFPGDGGGHITFCISNPPWAGGTGKATYCIVDQEIFAHEIAHNFGCRHPHTPDSGGANDSNTDWPYTDSTIGEYGYDFREGRVVHHTVQDVMSYRTPVWFSPFTYEKLFNNFSLASGAEAGGASAFAPLDYLMVGGVVSKTGSASFDPFWKYTADTPPDNPPPGTDYCLEMQDFSNTMLSNYCFNLAFTDPESGEAVEQDSFLVNLPWYSNAAQVVLRYNGTETGRRTASAHAPTVQLLSPAGGEALDESVQVQWASNDADGDPLAFNLFYSRDNGSSWTPVAMGLTETAYALDLSLLPGSSQARLRVEVSDGFYSAYADSAAPFTVSDHAPLAGISMPADGSRVRPSVRLHGAAFDAEDGELDAGLLTWSSNRDGPLGTGSPLKGLDLSEGLHQITLTAADSQGHTTTHSITLEVRLDRVYLPYLD